MLRVHQRSRILTTISMVRTNSHMVYNIIYIEINHLESYSSHRSLQRENIRVYISFTVTI